MANNFGSIVCPCFLINHSPHHTLGPLTQFFMNFEKFLERALCFTFLFEDTIKEFSRVDLWMVLWGVLLRYILFTGSFGDVQLYHLVTYPIPVSQYFTLTIHQFITITII